MVKTDDSNETIRDLKYLAYGELRGVIGVAGLYLLYRIVTAFDAYQGFRIGLVSFVPLCILILIVMESSFYWRNQMKRAGGQASAADERIGWWYVRLRLVNWGLIFLYAPLLMLKLHRGGISVLLGGGFYLCCILAQVRFFYGWPVLQERRITIKKSRVSQDIAAYFDTY